MCHLVENIAHNAVKRYSSETYYEKLMEVYRVVLTFTDTPKSKMLTSC